MSIKSTIERLQENRMQLVQQLNNVIAEINRLSTMRDNLIRQIDKQDGVMEGLEFALKDSSEEKGISLEELTEPPDKFGEDQ
jgi:peptidoglycan hydrolase CwlO-like protein